MLLLGNNHCWDGELALSDQLWETPLGLMQNNKNIINDLVTENKF